MHLTQDSSDSNEMIAIPVIMGSNAGGYTVDASNSCWNWYQDGGGIVTPTMQCAIYPDVSGKPDTGTKLCSSSTVAITLNASLATENWTYGVLSGCGTLAANTKYWAVFNETAVTTPANVSPGFDNAGTTYCTTAGTPVFVAQAFGTWPATFPTSATTACFDGGLNVTAVAGGGGGGAQVVGTAKVVGAAKVI